MRRARRARTRKTARNMIIESGGGLNAEGGPREAADRIVLRARSIHLLRAEEDGEIAEAEIEAATRSEKRESVLRARSMHETLDA